MIVNENRQPVPGPPPKRSFGGVRAVLLGVVIGALGFGSFVVRLPLVTLHPGPTPGVSELIKVETPATGAAGSLHITTVCVAGAVSVVGAIRGIFSPEIAVLPRSQIYPPGKSQEEVDKENVAQMDESQISAIIAALTELGYKAEPDGALVQSTEKGTPAARDLQSGDVIVAVDGKAVTTRDQIAELIRSRRVGDTVSIRVRRGEEVKDFSVKTIQSPGTPKRPIIGVALVQNFKLPFHVTIDSQNIGGPSAGLMFSIGIVDQLDPADLTRGFAIAGTGTIATDGKVGAVGGIAQKIAAATKIGADYFIVPKKEAGEALKATPKEMKVIAVDTLHEALAELRQIMQMQQPGKPPKERPKGIRDCR